MIVAVLVNSASTAFSILCCCKSFLISSSEKPRMCFLAQVIDVGAGLKRDEQPHLFERFYQGQSDRLATGSGLGLYLTRQIIEAHGGTIWAENRIPNGAIFGFRLPALPYSSHNIT